MTIWSNSRARLWLIAAGLLAVSVSASAASRPTKLASSATQQAFPPMVTLDGKPVSREQLRGKVVLINFWASWCAACRTELPSLERLAAKHRDLVVLAASVDSNRSAAIKAFDPRYAHLRLSFASLDAVQQFGALGMPYSVILSREGREAARVPRALDWEGDEALSFLARAGFSRHSHLPVGN